MDEDMSEQEELDELEVINLLDRRHELESLNTEEAEQEIADIDEKLKLIY